MSTKTYLMLLIIFLVISTGCLAAGYILAGYLLILLVFPLLALVWVFASKKLVFWSASIFLIGYVIFAAVGIVIGLSLALMITTCIAALVSWDLMLFNHTITENLPDKSILALRKYHLSSLALAASTGLILSLVSANISLQFPFVVIAFLVLVTIGTLNFVIQFVVKQNH